MGGTGAVAPRSGNELPTQNTTAVRTHYHINAALAADGRTLPDTQHATKLPPFSIGSATNVLSTMPCVANHKHTRAGVSRQLPPQQEALLYTRNVPPH